MQIRNNRMWRIGLFWGTVCAITLMGIEPQTLITNWQLFGQDPSWISSKIGWVFPHILLIISFILLTKTMQHYVSNWRWWKPLLFGILLWCLYLLWELLTGWIHYRYQLRLLANEIGITVDRLLISSNLQGLMQKWATSLVLNILPIRALSIIACTYAMAREINQFRPNQNALQ